MHYLVLLLTDAGFAITYTRSTHTFHNTSVLDGLLLGRSLSRRQSCDAGYGAVSVKLVKAEQ